MTYPEPYYAPGWPQPRPRLEGTAVAALVTGLLGLGPVAVALGVVALARTRRRGTRGRALAVTGVVLGAVGTVVIGVVVVLALAALTATRPLGEVSEPQTAHVQQLRPGHCLSALPGDGLVSSVQVVPCDHQHTAEVVHEGELDTWRSQAAADQAGAALCRAALTGGVLSEAQLDAGVEWVVWTPTAGSWRGGDRAVLCVAHAPGVPLVGSLLDGVVPTPSD